MGINFPASPTLNQKWPQPAVAGIPVYTWDGEKWTTVGGSIAAYAPPADAVPLMDATPGLVGTATEYAREDHVHPTDTSRMPMTAFASSLAYSGMQINGGMEVSQERGTAVLSGFGHVADVWIFTQDATATVTAAQVIDPLSFPGFSSFIGQYVGVAQTTMGATNIVGFSQKIEGYRISRLAWGTANAQPVTIGFWTKHFRTGVFTGLVQNGAANMHYSFAYTQAASGVAQYNVVTIPGPTTGTWPADNTSACRIWFTIAAGSTYTTPSNNSWLSGGPYFAGLGQVNGVAATSDIFRITGVTVLPGTQAPTAAQSPNIMRPYGEELVTCQRYYEQLLFPNSGTGSAILSAMLIAGSSYSRWWFQVRKRTTPTFALGAGVLGSAWGGTVPSISPGIDGVLFNHANAFYLNTSILGSVAAIADARL